MPSISISSDSPVYFLMLFLFVFAIYMLYRHYQLGRKQLERWAGENGLRLLNVEQRWLRAGPYTWNRSRGQLVYFVEVAPVNDPIPQPRSAFVKVGHWFGGTWKYAVAVHWEEVG